MPFTVLLVDDDADFREEFADAFEDFRVLEAGSGRRAMEILQGPNEVDLVVLDVMLPDARGTRLLDKIRAAAPGVSVVILTGYGTKDVAVEALKAHADEFVEKPFDVARTREILDRLLDARQNPVSLSDEDSRGKIERVKRFAERNYHKKVTLNHAAAAVGLSPKYLSRAFKQATGMGFSDYRLSFKVRRAKEMLSQTGRSVSQISDDLGYQNLETFIRLFKRFTRLTPSAFRARRRRGVSGREKAAARPAAGRNAKSGAPRAKAGRRARPRSG